MGSLPLLDYGARMLILRGFPTFTTADPLSEARPGESVFLFTGGDPVNRVDPDGREWVDAQGRAVWRNGAYTQHATADHRRIGDNLRRTDTGWGQFEKLVNHTAPIQTVINTTDAPVGFRDGKSGKITGNARFTTARSSKGGKEALSYGIITLYDKNISKVADGKGITYDEQIASTAGHEIEHLSDENVQLSIMEAPQKEIEKAPEAIGGDIIEEFISQKPVLQKDSGNRFHEWIKRASNVKQ